MMPASRTLRAALPAAALLALAGCGASATASSGSSSPAAAPSASAAAASPAAGGTIPVLHAGGTATFGDPQSEGVPEQESWKLTSVAYIPYAAAVVGGTDGDVAASLGANALKQGDRYLVLGLKITDIGPAGFHGDFTLATADFGWGEPSGATAVTRALCMPPPPPGLTEPDAQYASGICGTESLAPGQSVTGYLVAEVPDAPAVLVVIGPQSATPLLVVDPGNLVGKDKCVVKAKFC